MNCRRRQQLLLLKKVIADTEATVETMTVEEGNRGMTGEGGGTTTVVGQGDASPKARGTCPAAAGQVRGTTTGAIWAVVGMIALAEGATGLVTGRASAALHGYQETKTSASVATRGSRGLDADMLRNEVMVGTMAAGEGNRGTTFAECTCPSSSTKTCWRRQGRVSICVLLWERGCRTLMLSMLLQPMKACC